MSSVRLVVAVVVPPGVLDYPVGADVFPFIALAGNGELVHEVDVGGVVVGILPQDLGLASGWKTGVLQRNCTALDRGTGCAEELHTP